MNSKKKILFALMVLAGMAMKADPVTPTAASQAGSHFLQTVNEVKKQPRLTLKHTYRDAEGTATIYVFDIDEEGFILVSANDLVEPILGYSFNGVFDINRTSPNFASWARSYSEDIAAVVSRQQPLEEDYKQSSQQEWEALRVGDQSYYLRKGSKDVDALVSTRWDQGYGYNRLCPVYSGGPDGHSYTGCVATAMAQIIRYWGYPSTGFGTSSYSHFRYGRQTAVHDSVLYDYTHMPTSINYYSSDQDINAVALLCYHCGVSVCMDYQSVDKTDGSGAHTQDVAEAIMHFGYFNAHHNLMNDLGTTAWKALMKSEIDHGRPVLYHGQSGDGGHAFVLDGYRSSQDKYHFNWGWGGYQDGYFTMTNMNGYTAGQGGVYNIQPSHLVALTDTIYVDAEGTGDGSSWSSASPYLKEAIQARSFYKAGHIFVKEGIYYGDTSDAATSAFTLCNGVKVYGGFAGTESGIAERDTANHHTILDGQGKRALVEGRAFSKSTGLYDLTFQNGRSRTCASFKVISNMTVSGCTVRNCVADSTGDICIVNDGTLQNCTFVNNVADTNHTGTIISASGGKLRSLRVRNNEAWANVANSGAKIYNSLITHNRGIGVRCYSNDCQVVNCDITYNEGLGLSVSSAGDIRNTLVYKNLECIDTLNFNKLTFCALDGEELYPGNGNILLGEEDAVFWMDMSPRGPHANDNWVEYSWHLKQGSPCIDAGDSVTSGIPTTDLEGLGRISNSRIDIGCIEHRHYDDIEPAAECTFSIYPNPATSSITILGQENSDYQMFDIYGRLVREWSEAPAQLHVELTSLPRGLYLVRSGGKSIKVVKQ